MRIPGYKTALKSARWIRSRFGQRALILGYHRVAEPPHDPFGLCISPAAFEMHLQVLSEIACPVSLQDLRQGLRKGHLPRNAVVITFDDGYSDVFHTALPLLKKYNIPATLFVTAGSLGQPFWWDELERIVYASANLPELIASLPEPLRRSRMPASGNGQGDAQIKESLLRMLSRRMQDWPAPEIERVINRLRGASGLKQTVSLQPRAVTRDELRLLSDAGLFEIGSHTVSHPDLPNLSPEKQREEIENSKSEIESVVGRPVSSFSYPNGRNTKTLRPLLLSAGYQCACTSVNDLVTRGTDPFELPRFWPRYTAADRFTSWLKNWLVH